MLPCLWLKAITTTTTATIIVVIIIIIVTMITVFRALISAAVLPLLLPPLTKFPSQRALNASQLMLFFVRPCV